MGQPDRTLAARGRTRLEVKSDDPTISGVPEGMGFAPLGLHHFNELRPIVSKVLIAVADVTHLRLRLHEGVADSVQFRRHSGA